MRVSLKKVFFSFVMLPLLIGGVYCDKNKIFTTVDAKEFCGVGSFFKKSIKNFFIRSLDSDNPAETLGLVKVGGRKRFLETLHSTVFKEPLKIDYELFGDGVIGTIELCSVYKEGRSLDISKELRQAFYELKAVAPLSGLILDMRENRDSPVSSCSELVNFFLQKEALVTSLYRGPFLVLLSKTSGPFARMVASMLQQEGVALVVGDFDEELSPDLIVPTQYACLDLQEKWAPYLINGLKERSKKIEAEELKKTVFPNFRVCRLNFKKMVPTLSKNSDLRKKNDQNLYLFCKNLEDPSIEIGDKASQCGVEDLQKKEAINIIKDMIFLSFDAGF